MSTGSESRLAILRRDTESKSLGPLQTHGCTATIELVAEKGEYPLVSAERAGFKHRVAITYSSATVNAVYKALAPQVLRSSRIVL